jgi:DNA-directed RNA polymerase I, II, and III subunit RPABC2
MSDYEEVSGSEAESEEDEIPKNPVVKKPATEKAKTLIESESEEEGSDAESEESTIAVSDEDGDLSASDDEIEDEDTMYAVTKKLPAKKSKKGSTQFPEEEEEPSVPLDEIEFSDDEEEDDDDLDGTQYMQQFDAQVKEQVIANHHPELLVNNYDEVEALSVVVRDERGIIIDPLHKTLPFLTKYERTRILGERAKQLNGGAKALIETNPAIIDGYLIAMSELEQKKIPFIIRRPLNNGGSEYWKLKDLEII